MDGGIGKNRKKMVNRNDSGMPLDNAMGDKLAVTYEVGEIRIVVQVDDKRRPWHWRVSRYLVWKDYDFIGVNNDNPLYWSVFRLEVCRDILWSIRVISFVGTMSTAAKSLVRP